MYGRKEGRQQGRPQQAGTSKRTDGRRLESKIGLEVLGDLTDESLEGELSDEELGGLGKEGREGQSQLWDRQQQQRAGRPTFWYLRISRRATVPGLYPVDVCGE